MALADVVSVINLLILLAILGGIIFVIIEVRKYKKTVTEVVKIIDMAEKELPQIESIIDFVNKDIPEIQSILDEIKKDIPALGKGIEVINKLNTILDKLPFGSGKKMINSLRT